MISKSLVFLEKNCIREFCSSFHSELEVSNVLIFSPYLFLICQSFCLIDCPSCETVYLSISSIPSLSFLFSSIPRRLFFCLCLFRVYKSFFAHNGHRAFPWKLSNYRSVVLTRILLLKWSYLGWHGIKICSR